MFYKVLDVSDDGGIVIIQIRNIVFEFVTRNGETMMVSSYDPFSRIYDPDNSRVPSPLLNKAYRQASKILIQGEENNRKKTIEKKEEKQLSLF